MAFKISIDGHMKAIQALKEKMANIEEQIDEAVERRALIMVNETRQLAPVDTAKLRNSIDIITQETALMKRAYGTNVEYAQKQEYEHKTKKGFFRKTIAKNSPLLDGDIRKVIQRNGGAL